MLRYVGAVTTVYLLFFVSFGASFKDGFGPGKQDYGHVTVREGAHMFYWLYYTTADVKSYTDRPLTIWLQGGPGASSTGYGNFEELGPLDLDLNHRNHTWVKHMNVLFIDNPVGSGFSYVDDPKYLTTTNQMIALDLVAFMKEFYNQHPEFKPVPLHIFCESYGGKMAAEFALELYLANQRKEIDCNLQSAALGDSWVSPMDSMFSWSPLLLQMGLIDHKGAKAILTAAQKSEIAFQREEYALATSLWGQTQSVVMLETKGVDFYNILRPTNAFYNKRKLKALENNVADAMYKSLVTRDVYDSRDRLLEDLMKGPVSVALNISHDVVWGSQSRKTFSALSEDFMKPVIHIVETLLNKTNVNVVVYSGHLDLICATPGTIEWVDHMHYSYKQQYENAPRKGFGVNGILEGYSKTYKKFSVYWVNRAGHMVPNDNPAAMSHILQQVTNYG